MWDLTELTGLVLGFIVMIGIAAVWWSAIRIR
jgi:hypothetical protein